MGTVQIRRIDKATPFGYDVRQARPACGGTDNHLEVHREDNRGLRQESYNH